MRALGLVALALAVATGCTSGGSPGPRESEALPPPIATDNCPAAEDLLSPAEAKSAPGDRLPDLTLPCIGSDRTVSLRALGGTPTVLNVWASWCLPCRKEMPELQRVHATAAGRVRFLGVNVADSGDNAARATIQATGISYPSVRSEGRKMLAALRVPGPPITLFVDGAGTLVHRQVGELTADELHGLISKHLRVDLPAPA